MIIWKRILIVVLTLALLGIPNMALAEEDTSVQILKVLSEGQSVVDLQSRLRDLGYFNYKVTGYFGVATGAAVRNFQERNNITADGTVGPVTADLLYSCDARREAVASSETTGMLPVSRGGRTSLGKLVNWYSVVQYVYPRGSSARVTDLYTGITFTMVRTGGTNHADVEAAGKADSDKIRRIWGGWSWDRRPVIVEIGGERFAASMHGMPHAYNKISGNGMQGHVCLHFYKSRTHINNRQDPDHQAAVMRASGGK